MIRTGLLLSLLLACGDKAPVSPSSSVIGVLAEDSIDAYSNYLHKSKAAEARLRIRQIARGASDSMTAERIGADGQFAPSAPPAAAPMTPAAGSCCKQPQGKCVPTAADWAHPSWQALSFDIADPHYYSYELEPTTDGFVVRAVGDLDCDGVLATFEVRGTMKNGEVEIAEMTSTAPLE